ncbi:unnamed protein product [Allacma fusca]|uniref:Ferritin n=1 Tax=Allacma fusca TaxID=39272 RepID=A0A8J2KL17_9HEXA|nr:unnamed protein product [Allacma fusca]
MKLLISVILFISVHLSYQAGQDGDTNPKKCTTGLGDKDFDLLNMEDACSVELKLQIKKEFQASITYMAMGAHFSSEAHFRPGLAKFFIHSATEERTHAKKIVQFLLLRGVPIGEAALPPILLPNNNGVAQVTWESAEEALEQAYRLEESVTKSIENIVKQCEKGNAENGKNDYHAVDYLTGEFLAEQHEGLRTIAEYITSLKRMGKGALGEVLFDKTLLKD